MRLGQAVSGLVGAIGALWLGIAGGYATWWWDRRPADYPAFETRVLIWPVKWTAPDSLQAQLDALKVRRAAELARARDIGRRQAEASAAIGRRQAATQTAITARTRMLIREVPIYVTPETDARLGGLPWGLVRMHDAAALGVDPASLPNPAGEPDDAASSVEASDLAAAVAGNYAGVCRADAEQLRDLQAWVRAVAGVQAEPGELARDISRDN